MRLVEEMFLALVLVVVDFDDHLCDIPANDAGQVAVTNQALAACLAEDAVAARDEREVRTTFQTDGAAALLFSLRCHVSGDSGALHWR